MSGYSELRVFRPALPTTARPLRHALSTFLQAMEVDGEAIEDILMAVGEALANAVEHAYAGNATGIVELHACIDDKESLSVDVNDDGEFIERAPRPERGFGLHIVKQVARSVTVEVGNGTRVRMVFDATPRSVESQAT